MWARVAGVGNSWECLLSKWSKTHELGELGVGTRRKGYKPAGPGAKKVTLRKRNLMYDRHAQQLANALARGESLSRSRKGLSVRTHETAPSKL